MSVILTVPSYLFYYQETEHSLHLPSYCEEILEHLRRNSINLVFTYVCMINDPHDLDSSPRFSSHYGALGTLELKINFGFGVPRLKVDSKRSLQPLLHSIARH